MEARYDGSNKYIFTRIIMIEWKQIEGFEDYYVSNAGQIKSKNKILKHYVHKQGYAYLNVKPNGRLGRGKTFRIHRCVAIAFIPNPDNKPEINHKDGNRTNNYVSNLEWCTRAENISHKFQNEIENSCRGIRNGKAKFTEADIRYILSSNESISNLSKQFNVRYTTIYSIKNKKSWKHITIS